MSFNVQAFTITQLLETDSAAVRYWRVQAARMQGLEVEVRPMHGSDDDWEAILVWDDRLSRWRDLSDGATFSDLDFNRPVGPNGEPGGIRGQRPACREHPAGQGNGTES